MAASGQWQGYQQWRYKINRPSLNFQYCVLCYNIWYLACRGVWKQDSLLPQPKRKIRPIDKSSTRGLWENQTLNFHDPYAPPPCIKRVIIYYFTLLRSHRSIAMKEIFCSYRHPSALNHLNHNFGCHLQHLMIKKKADTLPLES